MLRSLLKLLHLDPSWHASVNFPDLETRGDSVSSAQWGYGVRLARVAKNRQISIFQQLQLLLTLNKPP